MTKGHLMNTLIKTIILFLAIFSAYSYSIENSKDDTGVVTIESLSELLSSDFEAVSDVAPQVNVPITIELIPEATITDSQIFLGRISSCHGYSEACNDSLGIDLGVAPLPGKFTVISKSDIERLLKEEYPNIAITFTGSSQSKVFSAAKDIDPLIIQAQLEKAILEKMPGLSDIRFKIDHVQIIQAPKVGAFLYQIEFPNLFSRTFTSADKLIESIAGHRSYQIHILLDGSSEKPLSGQIVATISVERLVVTAKHRLQKGQHLRQENVAISWIPVNGNVSKYLKDIDSYSQNNPPVLRSDIKMGDPIPFDRLEFLPLIQKGQLVNIILKNDGLEVLGKAKTLNSGNENDLIEVIYPVTKKTISAKIIDKSTVEVRF